MQVPPHERSRDGTSGSEAETFVDGDALVLRNYDSSTYTVTVTMHDAADELAFERTYELGPATVVSTQARLQRGVYEVTVRPEDGDSVSRECLIGSGPAETAVVETGNGVYSVAEGLV